MISDLKALAGNNQVAKRAYQTRRRNMATQNTRRKLEQIERTLERQWRSLALAEQRGQPAAVLERMYAAYLRTLDAYIVCARAHVGKDAASRLAS
jgi:muramidase (phage lysozyme)